MKCKQRTIVWSLFVKTSVQYCHPQKSYLKSSFWREIQNLNFSYGTSNFARNPKMISKCYFILTLLFSVCLVLPNFWREVVGICNSFNNDALKWKNFRTVVGRWYLAKSRAIFIVHSSKKSPSFGNRALLFPHLCMPNFSVW